ncbi:hypothetical protein [Saccharothrix texasensis]|uniref:Uncharacterized protein n=1 Tax=Saccharothrix texasensis TaxID=103734 RepID=A0A3N1HJL7_9PSEU|nr:hypothetical protein [Saccharothrix texasensis]ROP42679.1 hypothetical protein EDD40_8187 [Saccharothrix texasensis]
MRALLLASLLILGAAQSAPAQAAPAQAAPAQASPVQAAMDYWQYMATFATEEECEAEGAKIPEGVDYYACWPSKGAWDFYWVFLT